MIQKRSAHRASFENHEAQPINLNIIEIMSNYIPRMIGYLTVYVILFTKFST